MFFYDYTVYLMLKAWTLLNTLIHYKDNVQPIMNIITDNDC